MVTSKMRKFDELISRELALIINSILPESFISITSVRVSKDKSFAKIWISSTSDMDQILESLKSHQSAIKTQLANKVMARKIPKLQFVADTTEEEAQKIEKLISSIKQ